LDVILGSALNIPCINNSIDIVLALDLIEHIRDDVKVLKEIHRILKKGGVFLLTTPVKNKKFIPFTPKKFTSVLHYKWGHVREGYSNEELNSLLSKYNFQIIINSTFFNFLSRFVHLILFYFPFPLKYQIKIKIYKLFLHLENFGNLGFEHILLLHPLKSSLKSSNKPSF